MLACNETITLVRTDGETFSTEIINGVSWYDKAIVSKMERGLQASRQTSIRIPAESCPSMFPKPGDIVLKGEKTAIDSISDIKNETYCRVMTVSDNRRTGIGLKHVALTCE